MATAYESKWPKYLNETHSKAMELLEPEEGETILDAAAGTGALAQRIVSSVGEEGNVYMAEISPGMRSVARERFHRHPNVQIDSADVHELEYDDSMFDRLVCANAFHYFDKPEVVLSEFYRVLKPEGRFVLVDLSNDRGYFQVYDFCLRAFSRVHNRTYTTSEMTDYMTEAGFSVTETESWRFKLWSLMGLVGEV